MPKIRELVSTAAKRAVEDLVFEQRLLEAGGEVRTMTESQLMQTIRGTKVPRAFRIAAAREMRRRDDRERELRSLETLMRTNGR
jgi:hypothetical protein